MKSILVKIPDELHMKLKIYAIRKNTSVSSLVRDLIEIELEKEKKD